MADGGDPGGGDLVEPRTTLRGRLAAIRASRDVIDSDDFDGADTLKNRSMLHKVSNEIGI